MGPLTADGRPSGPAAGPPGPGTPDTGDGAALGAEFPPPPAELYDFYRRARPAAPVFYAPSVDMWVATRYDDVLAVLRDGERFEKHENVPPSTLVPQASPRPPHTITTTTTKTRTRRKRPRTRRTPTGGPPTPS